MTTTYLSSIGENIYSDKLDNFPHWIEKINMKIVTTLLENKIAVSSFNQQNIVSTSYVPGMILSPRDLLMN